MHLVLDHADDAPSAPTEVVLQESNHLQESGVEDSNDDVGPVSGGLAWEEGGLNLWPMGVARQRDEKGWGAFAPGQFQRIDPKPPEMAR